MTASIFSQAFPGDRNSALKTVQEDIFGELSHLLFFKAKDRYLEAARLLDIDSDLVSRLHLGYVPTTSRLLPYYCSIAAWFRFERYDLAQQGLFVAPQRHYERLSKAWELAFTSEADRLVRNDNYTRAMVELMAGPCGRKVDPADALEDLFEARYGGLDRKARRIHRLGSPSEISQSRVAAAHCC